MTDVFLGLGSNMGDSRAYLRDAVQGLAEVGVVWKTSSLYRTAPQGGPPQPDYLNAVVWLKTAAALETVWMRAQALEAAAGRVRAVRFGPRTLDVDILVYGAETRAGPTVIIPHPRLTQRRFVLEPWAEIAPDWRLPNGTRVADWLSQVRDQEVERLLPEAPFPSSFDPSNAR